MGDIPQPEKLILPHLFKTQPKLVLGSVSLDESWVRSAKAEMEAVLKRGLPDLENYKALYDAYLDVLQQDPAAYVKSVGELEPPAEVSTLKKMIEDSFAKEQEILDTIPESVVVGSFTVICKEVRKVLAGKKHQVANLLLDLLARRYHHQP